MARPREFNTNLALEGAMNVFWELGYEKASLPLLLKGMGLTRGSFYKAFNDKKAVFLEILQRYDAAAVETAVAILRDEAIPDGADRVAKLLNQVIDRVRGGDRRGCLLCSAIAGPENEDKDIARATLAMLTDMRAGFLVAIQATDKGRALDAVQRDNLADLLLTQYVGLRIISQSDVSVATLERSVQALDVMLRD